MKILNYITKIRLNLQIEKLFSERVFKNDYSYVKKMKSGRLKNPEKELQIYIFFLFLCSIHTPSRICFRSEQYR
jgi:hypothetical protein